MGFAQIWDNWYWFFKAIEKIFNKRVLKDRLFLNNEAVWRRREFPKIYQYQMPKSKYGLFRGTWFKSTC